MMTASASGRSPAGELGRPLPGRPGELGRGDITHDFAVDDLKPLASMKLTIGASMGLAPRRSDGNLLDAEPRQRIDERSRRRVAGLPCGSSILLISSRSSLALAREGRSCKDDTIDLGIECGNDGPLRRGASIREPQARDAEGRWYVFAATAPTLAKGKGYDRD